MGQSAKQEMSNRRGTEAEFTRMGGKREDTVPFLGFCWGPVTHSKVPLLSKVDQYCSAQSGPCSITKPGKVAHMPLLPLVSLWDSTESDIDAPMLQKACCSLSAFPSVSLSLSLERIPTFKIAAAATEEHKTIMLDRCLLNAVSSFSLHLYVCRTDEFSLLACLDS